MGDHPFTESKGKPDVVLVVGDQRFHVNKSVLIVASAVFEKMFEGKFTEKDAKEIELQEDDPSEFLTFLECLYPSVREPVTVKNALIVAKVADKYQVESLIKECDRILTADCAKFTPSLEAAAGEASTIVTYVEAAEKYGLKELLLVCTASAVKVKSGLIKKSTISHETQFEILRRRLECFEKMMQDFDSDYTIYNKEKIFDVYKKYKTGGIDFFSS